ncbi:YtxH domain-containing protein [Candidatus Gracilibacteria bacterium]|nr:YtxH domain-containing protein [Candidatus Gracilibacteria bacterium]
MKLFSKKTTFIVGSIIGSVAGLLFARESGKNLRGKLKSARSPQKKFEALFQEYLKIGKTAINEVQESEAMRELMKGGKEILAELKKKAETEGGCAVKFARKKTEEVLKEVERQANGIKKKARKRVTVTKKELALTKAGVLRKTAGARRAVKKLAFVKTGIARKITPIAIKKGGKKTSQTKKTTRRK